MTTEFIVAKNAIDHLKLNDALQIKNYLVDKIPEFKKIHEENCEFKVGDKVLFPSGLRGWGNSGTIVKINLVSALIIDSNDKYTYRIRFKYIEKLEEQINCGF